MHSVSFRRLAREDVPQLYVIETQSFATPWSLDSLYAELDHNDCALYLGAFEGERLLGYVGMWIILDEAHVTNLAVAPAFRKLGIGRKLMRELMRAARERGCVCMTLEVRESNYIARQLYQSCGFAVAGRRKRYYTDNHEDALVMWCEDLHCDSAINRV